MLALKETDRQTKPLTYADSKKIYLGGICKQAAVAQSVLAPVVLLQT